MCNKAICQNWPEILDHGCDQKPTYKFLPSKFIQDKFKFKIKFTLFAPFMSHMKYGILVIIMLSVMHNEDD